MEDQFQGDGLAVIGIGDGVDLSSAQQVVDTYELTFPVLSDSSGSIANRFYTSGSAPVMVILDGYRKFRWMQTDAYDPSTVAIQAQPYLDQLVHLYHDPLRDSEDTSNPYLVEVDVVSIPDLTPGTTNLQYSITGGSPFTAVPLTPVTRAQYSATIPSQPAGTDVVYYLEASNELNLGWKHPVWAPDELHAFHVGPDVTAPVVEHEPVDWWPEPRWPVAIDARVTDNLGLQSVTLRYSINGGPAVDVPMSEFEQDWYRGLPCDPVQIGDVVQYRVIARDASAAGNETSTPLHDMDITDLIGAFLWSPAPGSGSAAQVASHLHTLGYDYHTDADLPRYATHYKALFVHLGIYSDNHVLTPNEGQFLADYLDAGGRLLMEGGDTWYYDSQTPVHAYFGISGLADGSGDAGAMTGLGGSILEGMTFQYTGPNDWIDHLSPVGEAVAILQNDSPSYVAGVSRDSGTYKTVGLSVESGFLNDQGGSGSPLELVQRIAQFFDLDGDYPTATPTLTPTMGPTQTPVPTDTPVPTATPEPGSPTPPPTPEPEFGVRLELPQEVHPGEPFGVMGILMNSGTPRTGVPTFFILDVQGSLYFWPSWSLYDPPSSADVDFRLQEVPTGGRSIEVVPTFVWPDLSGPGVSGLFFYGAMLNSEMTSIIGTWDAVEWGYGP